MFDRGKARVERSSAGSAGGFSVIASDVKIKGSIASGNDVQIDGLVEGDVQCDHLSLGEGGRVIGKIAAEHVTIAGTVEGPITAVKVELLAAATVHGDVAYQELRIELGAKISGKLNWAQEKGLKLVKGDAAAE